jgi:NTP pyrophosphatase (non-canonical NTP hydrolase)
MRVCRVGVRLQLNCGDYLMGIFEGSFTDNDSVIPLEFKRVMMDVLRERYRQNDEWGESNHEAGVWLAILSEEIGEAAQAMLHDKFKGIHAGELRNELIQVATVAIQWIECIDRR